MQAWFFIRDFNHRHRRWGCNPSIIGWLGDVFGLKAGLCFLYLSFGYVLAVGIWAKAEIENKKLAFLKKPHRPDFFPAVRHEDRTVHEEGRLCSLLCLNPCVKKSENITTHLNQ